MKDFLAEQLIAKVMDWEMEDVARERPVLQAMAAYKYDEYQQFSPGMRFVESLAIWLNQFESEREREVAYHFIKEKLIFCSNAEMNHLVAIAYPDFIRPLLQRRAASYAGINEWNVSRVTTSSEFMLLQRQCLFLGMSPGARIDVFRRSNEGVLSHEQMWLTYQIPSERIEDMLEHLKNDVATILGEEPSEELLKFRTVVFLDDFLGSGISYLRRGDSSVLEGKLERFYRDLTSLDSDLSRLIDIDQTKVYIVLYMATEQARQHLENILPNVCGLRNLKPTIIVINLIRNDVSIRSNDEEPIIELIEKYYDEKIEDEHSRKGGSGFKYGFADCGLPLVLSENTPNNSISLLWAKTSNFSPLFRRVPRHG